MKGPCGSGVELERVFRWAPKQDYASAAGSASEARRALIHRPACHSLTSHSLTSALVIIRLSLISPLISPLPRRLCNCLHRSLPGQTFAPSSLSIPSHLRHRPRPSRRLSPSSKRSHHPYIHRAKGISSFDLYVLTHVLGYFPVSIAVGNLFPYWTRHREGNGPPFPLRLRTPGHLCEEGDGCSGKSV